MLRNRYPIKYQWFSLSKIHYWCNSSKPFHLCYQCNRHRPNKSNSLPSCSSHNPLTSFHFNQTTTTIHSNSITLSRIIQATTIITLFRISSKEEGPSSKTTRKGYKSKLSGSYSTSRRLSKSRTCSPNNKWKSKTLKINSKTSNINNSVNSFKIWRNQKRTFNNSLFKDPK